MISLKCKSCGDLIFVDGNDVSVVCPSCGNAYEVPTDEKKEQYLNLYSRADDAWDHKDFEEATELYQNILNSDNTQAEAHFGLVLCKYGITYEVDPVTQKKMPTCNRINRDSILDDKHFQSAVKYASKEAAASFQRRAQEIDRISRDFLKIVDKEPPYDVFISYKRTAADGSITQDSKVARKLYFHLKEKGFKVFFAEETLKTIAGEKYEPYIFAALSSAPVMILVGSTRDHFEATWVKNEWRRYLALMNQGLKKTLIPAYFDMDPYNMPGELRNLQAMNAADFTFHEDLTEIIRKKVTDAKSGQINTEVQGQSLREKYATKDKVDKLVDATDCDREFAINVLVQCHGDFKQSQQYIEEDPGYKKSLWICAECHASNTHDKCHHCGISKKESVEVARARKEMEERARKKSAEYKRQKAEAMKKVLAPIIVIAVLAALAIFVVWPNMDAKSLYTPEIVQSYCSDTNKILTITDCTQDGHITATLEINSDAGYYNVVLKGVITSKKNNGDIEIQWDSNEVVNIPSGKSWSDEKTATITDKYQELKSFSKSSNVTFTAGINEEYTIKTAEDFQKLIGSNGTYHLKNDIDLAGMNWTPIEGFSGTLMGNGFTIKNLTIDASASNVGMFSTLSGYVKDLNFENANVTVMGSNENIGVLCGTLYGITNNCMIAGVVSATESINVGGIAGYVSNLSSHTMENLINKADISGKDYVGGIFGKIFNEGKFVRETATFKSLTNNGDVKASGNYVGGIFGYGKWNDTQTWNDYLLQLETVENTGDISGEQYVGGLFGYMYVKNTSSYLYDYSTDGMTNGESNFGDIAGKIENIAVK